MTQMLLDEIQPVWHFGSHHSLVVDATADAVAEAIESYRFDRDASPFVRFLFRARGLSIPSDTGPREVLDSIGFSVLGERPRREIVFGITGKFWAPREMAHLVRVPDAHAFAEFDRPGEAKGAIAFQVEPMSGGRALLRTETRVTCTDTRARLLFLAYWTLIRIPSGLIRHDLLRSIARRAEEMERTGAVGATR